MDQLSLFDGDSEKTAQLEVLVVQHLGLPHLFSNVGQVYPRSLDLQTMNVMTQLASGPASLCRTLH